ncbi:hypothetical protein P4H66_17785 [Paenibacillus dokdonensis]|uniref:DUF6199 domain-containing protein n=1 Tax=Paenibacillus dokdonensis TaxID=2567944 RepID=A0ABU6GU40_9BACL|nr:DUF6199 family natural product biosynthesis protein [Paenibacillus dokdonensis]MEC0241672.1 hypothetical protein [Paenibacillus dokdonensis]
MSVVLILFGIIILALGVIQIRKPAWGWRVNEGWKVEGESEPSEAYLVLAEIGGILIVVMGAFLILVGIFKLLY